MKLEDFSHLPIIGRVTNDGLVFSSLHPHEFAVVSSAPLGYKNMYFKTAEEENLSMFRSGGFQRISESGLEQTKFPAYIFGILKFSIESASKEDKKKDKLVYALKAVQTEDSEVFKNICLTDLKDINNYQPINQQ